MKDKIEKFINTRQFHMCMILFIILLIILGTLAFSLRYSIHGETKLPFELSKITVISTVEGNNNEDTENKWNLNTFQNNDIYLYIKKNDIYDGVEVLEKVTLNNFKITKEPKVGSVKLFKPDTREDTTLFKNIDDNIADNIEYIGDTEANMKQMKISNQGGLIVFRSAISDIGNYISNDDELINHEQLLQKFNINQDNLEYSINFDITIKLKNEKTYQANISLDLPVENIVEAGTQSKEYTDLNDIVFKRVQKNT